MELKKLIRNSKYLLLIFFLPVITGCSLVITSPQSNSDKVTLASANQPDLLNVVSGVHMGAQLRISDLNLEQTGNVELNLERFPVFTEDAKILVNTNEEITPPENLYFRGHATEMPESIVVVSLNTSGEMDGIITDESGSWLLKATEDSNTAGLANQMVNDEQLRTMSPFTCANESESLTIENLIEDGMTPSSAQETTRLAANVTHTARIAVETDYEYYAKFNNVTAALNYMGNLIAYASTLYEREVNTNLVITWSRLWTNGPDSDPWVVAGASSAALAEFRNYWNSNMTHVNRTIAHMLRGGPGGGIAYIGVLCRTDYGYGITSGISGNFDINNPKVVWDIKAMAHEIGHNFGSGHTFDSNYYNPVIDDSSTLPSGCPGWGKGCFTIMSYGQWLTGDYANIAFTLGKNFIYGVNPERVPARISTHINNVAAGNSSCLELYEPTIPLFITGFEDGNILPTWTGTIDWSINVSGYTATMKPQCFRRLRGSTAQTGTKSLTYSGTANGGSATYCYFKVFQVTIPITSSTKLSYWIYPEQDNGRYVAVDFHCTDGTTLRDSGALDQNGKRMHPNAGHGGAIPLNSWSQIVSNVGKYLNGKTIDKIWVAYDRPRSTGQFKGFIDNILISK